MKRAVIAIALLICSFWLGCPWAWAQTSFRFIAWGDSRGSTGANTTTLSSLSNQVNGLSPRPVFTLFDGDLCNSWSSACTVNGSGGWVYSLNNGSPGNGMYNITFPFRGNHDNSASGWDSTFNGHAQATVTAIGGTHFSYYSSDGANRTYSFDYGNSHFVGVDMPGGDISSMASGQITWLDSDIAAAEGRGVTHTFVLDHGPIWPINEHSSTAPSSLITVLNKHTSVSATFHGHEHVLGYAHIDSSRVGGVTHPWEEFVSGASGAPLYSCTSGVSEYCTSTNGFMTVDVNGNTFTVNLYFQGQAVPAETWSFTKSTPVITITPTSASFGNQSVGATSPAQALTLKNGTTSSVSISSIAITGTNSGDFAQTNTCGSSLAVGASCTINATFKPTVTGARTAAVTVTDSGTGSPHTAALSGTGVTSSASVSPTSLTFPSQAVSTTSPAQSSTLTNAGTVSLAITSIAVSGDFAETDNCGSSVAAGGSCTISVTFRPTAAGTRTGTLTINDSASNTPQTVSLSGTGTSSAAAVSLLPASLTFASQTVGTTSAAQTSTLSNSGGTALAVTSIVASGDFAQTNNCGSSVAAGGSCTISATFKPTATGTRTGTVTVTDSATSSPQTLSLTGSGAATAPAVSLSPASLTFASQTVGGSSAAQAVTLRNTGGLALTITSISTAAPFAQTNNCGSSVAAGASCTVSVTFTPTVASTVTGTLAVADNAAGSPQAVSLSGTGTSAGGGGLDYYVSPSGSNSGSGSAASPWATIAYASTKVGPGATVHVAAGTYSGPEFSTRASGTAAARITYISDTKWGAKLVGTSGSTWSNYGNYVDIVNFDVTGPGYNGLYTEGDHTRYLGNNVHDVLTSSCNSTGGSGINLNGTNAEVNGNYVHNNGPSTACNYVHGIYFLVQGGSAYNNIVFGNAGWGIQLWHDPSHINIVNNTLFKNQTGGIVIGNDTSSADYCVVNNNIVFDNARGISEEGTTGTHNVYQNNLVYQNPTSNYALQNGNTATGTVSANPLFVNYTGDKTGDYHLTAPSTCENGGTTNGAPTPDYDGARRPYGPTPDIGALEYTGSTSTVTLSPSALTFAGQAVGTTSTTQTLTLKNGTSTSLTISNVAITGTNSGDFTLTNGCSANLAAAASCTINVTFKPTAAGSRTAAVTVTDNATGSPRTATLTGTGTAATVTLSPSSRTFASQAIGTTSAAQALTLTNGTGSALAISSVAVTGTNSGDFAQTNGCGASLAVGASCTISVTFTPTVAGTRTATLTVTDSGPGSPHSASLTGTGGASAVALSPNPLSFLSQAVGTSSAALSATLTNTGSAPLTITNTMGISGDYAFGGSGDCPAVGSSVPAGASCTIDVIFTPTVTGTRTGAVTVSDNAAGSPHILTLTGTGGSSTAPAVSLSPAQLSFDAVSAGTLSVSSSVSGQAVTLRNGGDAPLLISGVSITAPFAQTNNCGTSLAARATCAFSVTFAPPHSGKYTGSLVITDNAPDSPQSVALAGALKNFKVGGGASGKKTISAGQSAAFVVDVTPEGGFNDPVSLNCTGAPTASTCTVSPATVTPDGTNPITATVTLQTTARTAASLYRMSNREAPPLQPGLGLLCPLLASVFFGLTLLRGRRQWRVGLSFVAICLSLFAMAACGGGGGQLAARPSSGTPAGTYTLTVTGTGGAITQTATLTVEVQ